MKVYTYTRIHDNDRYRDFILIQINWFRAWNRGLDRPTVSEKMVNPSKNFPRGIHLFTRPLPSYMPNHYSTVPFPLSPASSPQEPSWADHISTFSCPSLSIKYLIMHYKCFIFMQGTEWMTKLQLDRTEGE